jgi:hypothetical protein
VCEDDEQVRIAARHGPPGGERTKKNDPLNLRSASGQSDRRPLSREAGPFKFLILERMTRMLEVSARLPVPVVSPAGHLVILFDSSLVPATRVLCSLGIVQPPASFVEELRHPLLLAP